MKRFTMLAVLLGAGFVMVSAQSTVKAVKWDRNSTLLDIVEVNPSDINKVSDPVHSLSLAHGQEYVQNSLFHDEEANLLYFFTQNKVQNGGGVFGTGNQTMVVADATSGKEVRNLPFLNSNVIAPFFIGERNQLGFISTRTNSNGYGNNEDDISMVFFDMGTGEIAHKVELPSLSFNGGLTAPFSGKGKSFDRFGRQTEIEASLSSPCYIASKGRLLISAKDVTGTNRIFRINANNGEMESKLSVPFDVLDMVYDNDNGSIIALYVETGKSGKTLNIGKLDYNTYEVLESTVVRALESSETAITDGYIKLNMDNGEVYVGKSFASTGTQQLFTFNSDLELTKKENFGQYNENIEFEFPTTFGTETRVSLATAVEMYPNPASKDVTITSSEGVQVTSVKVMDNTGKVVKMVEVQSGALMNDITIDNLMPGMYFVEIQSNGAESVNKKLIVQ